MYRIYEAPSPGGSTRTLVADAATWRAVMELRNPELRQLRNVINEATRRAAPGDIVRLNMTLEEARAILAAAR